ncbi:MAG: hypothetical protein HZB26_16920 [Candidatus Hydrogenedentes bacterium]|nr:hypothetical protein [Candidatus Hydrogenedentota bacterium]
MGMNPEQPIVMYAITYTHRFSKISTTTLDYVKQTTAFVLQAFAELSRRHPDWQFVLRPHPHDMLGPNTLREQASAAGLERVWIDDKKSTPLFAVTLADVMVCTQSNLGIEAILAGKPVVNVVIDEFGHDVFYEGLGPLFLEEDAVIHVRTVEGILSAIEAAVEDPATRKRLLKARPGTIERFHYKLDGKAMERFCTLALEIAEDYARYVPPITRFPEFEPLLAQATPSSARRILVAGIAAKHAADAVRRVRPGALVEESRDLARITNAQCDVLILSDPVPHSEEAEVWLGIARTAVGETGELVAAFRHGGSIDAADAVARAAWAPANSGVDSACPVGEYSRNGVELVLSRGDFEIQQVWELRNAALEASAMAENPALARCAVDGWVVLAAPRRG